MAKPAVDDAFFRQLERQSSYQRSMTLQQLAREHGAGFARAVQAELDRRIETRKVSR